MATPAPTPRLVRRAAEQGSSRHAPPKADSPSAAAKANVPESPAPALEVFYRHLPIYQHLWETAAARWPQPKKQAYGVCLRPPSARGRRGEVTKVVLFPPLTTTGLTC
ncbi:MAG: hypothetical protein QGG09_01085 [Pirellulaceae bacterium]|nr:hypothetical protein [Pirellulaceae bacterium]